MNAEVINPYDLSYDHATRTGLCVRLYEDAEHLVAYYAYRCGGRAPVPNEMIVVRRSLGFSARTPNYGWTDSIEPPHEIPSPWALAEACRAARSGPPALEFGLAA